MWATHTTLHATTHRATHTTYHRCGGGISCKSAPKVQKGRGFVPSGTQVRRLKTPEGGFVPSGTQVRRHKTPGMVLGGGFGTPGTPHIYGNYCQLLSKALLGSTIQLSGNYCQLLSKALLGSTIEGWPLSKSQLSGNYCQKPFLGPLSKGGYPRAS